MVCQLYDSSSTNATLIGIEYMIDSKTYQALPDREKPNWHYHKEEFSPDRANPKFRLLNEQQQKEWMAKLSVLWKGNSNLEPNGCVTCIPTTNTTSTTSIYGKSNSK